MDCACLQSLHLSVHPSCEIFDGFHQFNSPFTINDLHSLRAPSQRKPTSLKPKSVGNHSRMPSTQSSRLTNEIALEHCLREHTREEELDESNAWYCSQCKKHQRAKKIVKFWAPTLPEVMILVLKRVEFRDVSALLGQGSGGFLHREKISAMVDFPINGLDLTAYCAGLPAKTDSFSMATNDRLYDLFAVCNHFGRLGSGHYTAMARDWRGAALADQCQRRLRTH